MAIDRQAERRRLGLVRKIEDILLCVFKPAIFVLDIRKYSYKRRISFEIFVDRRLD